MNARFVDSLAIIDNVYLLHTTDYIYHYESNNFLTFISKQPIISLILLSNPFIVVTDLSERVSAAHIVCPMEY